MLSEDIGSNYSLRTENTKTIVAALNEILGKDIICNAVGSPLLTTDTFAQMGEKINVMVNDFKAKLMGLGVSVSSVDKIAALIEKIGEIDLGVDADELLQTYIDSLKQILIENGVEVNGNETLAELIVKVGEGFKNKTGVDIISAIELPVPVKDKQLVVVTDTPMTGAVFHNLQPTIGSGIQEGGVWINTTNNSNVFEYVVSDSPKFSFYILDCYQVIGGSYVKKQIYCGVNGVWQHVNPNLYYVQEFINDKPLSKTNGFGTISYNEDTGCQRMKYSSSSSSTIGFTYKTNKHINTTGFSKVGIRFSANYQSTVKLLFYDVVTNSRLGIVDGTSSSTVITLELDISEINDLCYITVDIDSIYNVSGDYIVDIYDLYLTN
jgi:hypothetical protein